MMSCELNLGWKYPEINLEELNLITGDIHFPVHNSEHSLESFQSLALCSN